MKTFIIEVKLNEEYYEEMINEPEMFETFDDEEGEVDEKKVEQYKKDWNETNGKHEITTLEEYFNLIDKVRELADDYQIYNEGTLIVEE